MIDQARRLAVVVVVVATVAALYNFVVVPVACERRVVLALAGLSQAEERPEQVRVAAGDRTLRALRGCECVERSDFKLSFARGTAYHFLNRPEDAIAAYRTALTLARRPEIYLALGLAQLNSSDQSSAMTSFVAAGIFSPAQVAAIPYEDLRNEVKRRIREAER